MADGAHPLDEDAILSRLAGDEDLLREIAQTFLDTLHERLDGLERAVRGGDPAAMEVDAHALKGAASNFDETLLTKTALAMEQAARAKDTARAQGFWPDLRRDALALEAALKALLASRARG